VYIGQTKCLIRRIQEYNSGHGSTSTDSLILRPFVILAYSCGFDNNRELCEHAECKLKRIRNTMIQNSVDDPRLIVKAGQQVINDIDCNRIQNIETTGIASICLFHDD
jgi:predicted GIY-YIG superfamily endonuclease